MPYHRRWLQKISDEQWQNQSTLCADGKPLYETSCVILGISCVSIYNISTTFLSKNIMAGVSCQPLFCKDMKLNRTKMQFDVKTLSFLINKPVKPASKLSQNTFHYISGQKTIVKCGYSNF